MQHIISAKQFTRNYLEGFFEVVSSYSKGAEGKSGLCSSRYHHLDGHIMGSLFLEPSTRTRLSFESAMYRLGGDVITVSDAQVSSIKKGESLEATLRTVQEYADILVVRTHFQHDILERAAKCLDIPLINAGTATEHPSQTLLDLYTIWEKRGSLDGAKVLFFGDNRHARTVISLKDGLSLFDNVEVRNVDTIWYQQSRSGDMLHPSIEQYQNILKSFKAGLKWADIIYVTRAQRERWLGRRYFDIGQYNNKERVLCINKSILPHLRKDAMIMHPLPHGDELSTDIYQDERCQMWNQVRNGLFVRMALIEQLTG